MTAATLAARVDIPSPAAGSPDADLIRLCTEYVALSRELNRLMDLADELPRPAHDTQIQAVVSRLGEMVPAVSALPATTPEGIRAKATFVLHHASADADQGNAGLVSEEHVPAHSLALDLLRDTALPPAAPAAASNANPSRLLAIADELDRLNTEIDNIETDPDAHFESGRGADVLQAWWAAARAVPPLPVESNGDLVALGRICRATWKRTEGDDCPLRDELDQKLSAAVIAGAASPATADDDAELISECAAFDALERRRNALLHDGDGKTADEVARDEAISDQLYERQHPHFDRIMSLPATTIAGVQAKVRTLTLENLEILKSGSGDRSDCLVTSICRDVLGGIFGRDTSVLLACAEARRLRAETDAFPSDMDEAFEELCGRQSEAVRAVGAVKATSFAGLRPGAADPRGAGRVRTRGLQPFGGGERSSAASPATGRRRRPGQAWWTACSDLGRPASPCRG